jgi:hypothetical protein
MKVSSSKPNDSQSVAKHIGATKGLIQLRNCINWP